MSDACTIYIKRVDYQAIYDEVASLAQVPVEVSGFKDDWQSLTVTQQSTITFNSMRQNPGTFDEFSELILGTYSFFRKIETSDEDRKNAVLMDISQCQFAIGIGGFPEFNEAEGHYDMIFAVAKALNGCIFNGSGMIDEEGLMLLNSDGTFDEGS